MFISIRITFLVIEQQIVLQNNNILTKKKSMWLYA